MIRGLTSDPFRVIRLRASSDSVLPGLRAHLYLFDPALLHGEEIQEVGKRGGFIQREDL